MRRLAAVLRATFTAAFAAFMLFVVGTPVLLYALLRRDVAPIYSLAHWTVRAALRLAGVRLEVIGADRLRGPRPCIYMANHQSNVDPPVLFAVLPPRIAFMGKKSLFSIPVLGAAMRLGDFVPVHREHPEEARASVDDALEKLNRGVTLLVYPEGKRSLDARLLPFKTGVFLLALRAGVPIVPITVDGADRVMAKGKWEIYPGVVRVTVHPPVETRGRRPEERRQLAAQVRAAIASALPPDLRGEPAAPAAADPDDTL
ncbi:MAG: lysophospholipid acyltransferase family protein [Candidatus Acidiferrales bacterium]